MAKVENKYDSPDKVRARKDQDDPWVMYLIVRKSLGMGVGKTAAQVGHAVGMLYGRYEKWNSYLTFMSGTWDPRVHPATDGQLKKITGVHRFNEWMEHSFRKIVLKADDKQWEKLKEEHDCFVVRDAGLTEVEAGSETVIGLWPMKKSERSTLIKKLQVLK